MRHFTVIQREDSFPWRAVWCRWWPSHLVFSTWRMGLRALDPSTLKPTRTSGSLTVHGWSRRRRALDLDHQGEEGSAPGPLQYPPGAAGFRRPISSEGCGRVRDTYDRRWHLWLTLPLRALHEWAKSLLSYETRIRVLKTSVARFLTGSRSCTTLLSLSPCTPAAGNGSPEQVDEVSSTFLPVDRPSKEDVY